MQLKKLVVIVGVVAVAVVVAIVVVIVIIPETPRINELLYYCSLYQRNTINSGQKTKSSHNDSNIEKHTGNHDYSNNNSSDDSAVS